MEIKELCAYLPNNTTTFNYKFYTICNEYHLSVIESNTKNPNINNKHTYLKKRPDKSSTYKNNCKNCEENKKNLYCLQMNPERVCYKIENISSSPYYDNSRTKEGFNSKSNKHLDKKHQSHEHHPYHEDQYTLTSDNPVTPKKRFIRYLRSHLRPNTSESSHITIPHLKYILDPAPAFAPMNNDEDDLARQDSMDKSENSSVLKLDFDKIDSDIYIVEPEPETEKIESEVHEEVSLISSRDVSLLEEIYNKESVDTELQKLNSNEETLQDITEEIPQDIPGESFLEANFEKTDKDIPKQDKPSKEISDFSECNKRCKYKSVCKVRKMLNKIKNLEKESNLETEQSDSKIRKVILKSCHTNTKSKIPVYVGYKNSKCCCNSDNYSIDNNQFKAHHLLDQSKLAIGHFKKRTFNFEASCQSSKPNCNQLYKEKLLSVDAECNTSFQNVICKPNTLMKETNLRDCNFIKNCALENSQNLKLTGYKLLMELNSFRNVPTQTINLKTFAVNAETCNCLHSKEGKEKKYVYIPKSYKEMKNVHRKEASQKVVIIKTQKSSRKVSPAEVIYKNLNNTCCPDEPQQYKQPIRISLFNGNRYNLQVCNHNNSNKHIVKHCQPFLPYSKFI